MSPAERYIDLLKKTLSFALWPEPAMELSRYAYLRSPMKRSLLSAIDSLLSRRGLLLMQRPNGTDNERLAGKIWPGYADTMISTERLDNIQWCVEAVIKDRVAGDLIETGVWRGGACILMRGILEAYGITDKRVFVADSFEGLPPPDLKKYPQDAGDDHYTHEIFRVTQQQVENNFRRYRLLDDRVVFLKGFFHQSLPVAPIESLSVLRLDGDMYGSTMDAIQVLYPKLSRGGFCIVDDYALKGCRQAIDDYRSAVGINVPLQEIDWTGRFWRKE